VKRASPMPPLAYFTPKITMSLIFSAIVVALLFGLGFALGGVNLPAVLAFKLFLTLLLGSLPFCALGLAVGYFAGPNSAVAVLNLIYLPLSFCSGLWVPLMFLPKLLRQFAHLLPPYHLSQLALGAIGGGEHESTWGHCGVLISFTLICLGIARLGSQRDENQAYG